MFKTVPTAKANKGENLFAGRSTLRAEEKKKEEAPKNPVLNAYLAKMYGGDDDGNGAKKKKKRKAAPEASGAIRIVDHDAAGFAALDAKARKPAAKRAPGMPGFDDDEEDEGDAPTIANPEEAAALEKLAEKAKSGAGWVTADEARGRAGGGAGPSRQRHDSPDASPPRRRQRHDSPDASPPRRGRRHDSPDAEPPRRGPARHDSPDAEPPRRKQRAASPDAEPPRRGQRQPSPDASPPRRGQRKASPDASPPRRRARHDSPDASPPRRQKPQAGAPPDASPPRRGQRQPSPDASPPRRVQQRQGAAAPDASPPRRGQQQQRRAASPDASPPRRGGARHDRPDASPPRRGARHDSPGASPPRRRQRHDSPDAEPERRPRPPGGGEGPPRPGAMGPPRPGGVGPPRPGGTGPPRPPTQMGDGTAAGLVDARQLAADLTKQKQAAEERRRTAVGAGAQTVYRDKATGRVMSADEALQAKEDERAAKKKKPSIYDEDQTLEWRGGLAQKREAEQRRKEAEEEAAKPFARADVDDRHDSALRHAVRFGDPFAHLARKRAPAGGEGGGDLTERYDADKLNKSGFKVPQEVPPHSWLKRGVAAPANRYNMRPGRHWDGVNRSNGFEADLFKHQNTRAAQELEARLWSMGDM